MATLVLTAAGSLLGPIGGAVGALIGQAIDGRILKPGVREGPRLQDLRVQSSSYGTPVPKLFGTMRVAGTVIWSTDLVERRARQDGGKGRPSTTSYSYSASFAVALSSRPIVGVRRIWADGNLLRGAAGDWKQETGFRLHLGEEDQDSDPFIVSAEGVDGTPAFRGLAYAMFENMALGPYGNRIPSLTFEVDADLAPVAIHAMLSDLTDGAVGGAGGPLLDGFAASGDSVAEMIAALGQAFPLALTDTGARLEAESGAVAITVPALEIAEGEQRRRPGAHEAPASVLVSHFDPARDYQVGTQSHASGPGRRVERVDLPAALSAGAARALAAGVFERRRRERDVRSIACGWNRIAVAPGMRVRIGTETAEWRVVGRSVERTGVRLDLRSNRLTSLAARVADSGRGSPTRDQIHGPTRLSLIDVAIPSDEAPTTAELGIACWGANAGWRRASVLASFDRGASWDAIGPSALAAVAGVAETTLPIGSTGLIDEASVLTVHLAHEDMALDDADTARLLAGANLALVGEELIQFGTAVPIGDRRWRLSRLLRGRGGTEWAAAGHAPGERFVLIERGAVLRCPVPLVAIGAEVRVMASGIGDATPIPAAIEFQAEALRPLSPVHLRARPREDNGFDIAWVRRSRAGWTWSDQEVPLAETVERYRLTFRRANGIERATETDMTHHDYAAADAALDRMAGDYVDVTVAQLGTHNMSRPAVLRIEI